MSDAVCINRISKAYGEKTVFSDLSLTFDKNAVTCIMGPSGSGKTTLLRIIAGLEKPDSGEIVIDSGSVAFIFQEDRLSENFSAVSNIRLVTGKKMSREEIVRHLDELSLGEVRDKPVRELSGGMKRRVAIARAVCYGADVLLMDEPFKGLDEKLRYEVMDYVKRHSEGRTVIFVTHDRSEAEYMGGRVIRLGET